MDSQRNPTISNCDTEKGPIPIEYSPQSEHQVYRRHGDFRPYGDDEDHDHETPVCFLFAIFRSLPPMPCLENAHLLFLLTPRAA